MRYLTKEYNPLHSPQKPNIIKPATLAGGHDDCIKGRDSSYKRGWCTAITSFKINKPLPRFKQKGWSGEIPHSCHQKTGMGIYWGMWIYRLPYCQTSFYWRSPANHWLTNHDPQRSLHSARCVWKGAQWHPVHRTLAKVWGVAHLDTKHVLDRNISKQGLGCCYHP